MLKSRFNPSLLKGRFNPEELKSCLNPDSLWGAWGITSPWQFGCRREAALKVMGRLFPLNLISF